MSAIPIVITLLCLGQTPSDEKSLKALQQRVETTQIALSNDAGRKMRLVEKPVFRYSDQLRRIEDAGLWVWTNSGRPVAAMKVEHYQPGVHPRPWLYCFTSLSSELVTAEWTGDMTFKARKPGVTWKPLDDSPASTRSARLTQMREIARRFAAEIERASDKDDRLQMRLLPRPLFRYDEGLADAVDGALFGFTGTGTNPDLLLLLDLPKDGGWRFGFSGMTAEGLVVRLNERVVWQISHSAGKDHVFENWIYFVPNK